MNSSAPTNRRPWSRCASAAAWAPRRLSNGFKASDCSDRRVGKAKRAHRNRRRIRMVGTARVRLCPPELRREQGLMPKIDLSALPARSGTTYPEPFAGIVDGREWQSLGAAAGLSLFGVNLVRL